MLFELLYNLRDSYSFLNVFRYVSFRIIAALLTALLTSLFLYPWFIHKLQMRQIGQVVRDDGPSTHFSKAGTPTMGGLMVLFVVVITTLLWTDLHNSFVWLTLLVTVGFGFIGFMDDYMKIAGHNTKGMSGKVRLVVEFLLIGGVIFYLYGHEAVTHGQSFLEMLTFKIDLFLPFVSTEKFSLQIPIWLYIPFAMTLVVGTGNAVNLTDGLDGLAIGPTILAAGTFLVLCWGSATVLSYSTEIDGQAVMTNFDIAKYLMIPKTPGVQELSIFCASIIGTGIGFLWYNTFPAQVFMGDVGSLSLGGALGTLAVITRHEILSAIIFGLFLIEALSVIIQTVSFKLTGKRVFKMAPIHHHFEMKGWAEPKIIVRFWIVSFFLCVIALASLKLR